MRNVRQVPRFGCDFCKKISTKATIARHEPTCFSNPNRLCRACKNTGKVLEYEDWDYGTRSYEINCPYCVKYNEWLSVDEVLDVPALENKV